MKKRFILFTAIFLVSMNNYAQEKTLEYMYRYNCHKNPTADHLMCAEQFSADRIVVAGNLGLALINPNTLPLTGTQESIQQFVEYNIRNIYVKDKYIYANINSTNSKVIPGFDIFKIENDVISLVKEMSETNVFFEKMCIAGNYLYVTAHRNGLRIYDISDRENPTLSGKILDGFTDAYAISISGDSAYVADGRGGLKVVNVSDKQNPKIVFSEATESIIGTSQAITTDSKIVYMVAGSEGLLVYNKSDLNNKTVIPTNAFAEECGWAGNLLFVTCYTKVLLFNINSNGIPTLAAHENMTRRENGAVMRLLAGAGSMNDSILMCANWNYLDFYKIKDASKSSTPDINSNTDRIRFNVNGGTQRIALSNNGYGSLSIQSITNKNNSFKTNFVGPKTLNHNDTVWVDVTYTTTDAEASDVLLINSNDIDENPLPIQVYGKTQYLDPGEKAVDFNLNYLTRNNTSGVYSQSTLRLSDYVGKVVWFPIFGSSCPACPPVLSDMQTKVFEAFKNNPNVVTFIFDGKEGEGLSRLQQYFDWYYLNTGIAYEETAATFSQFYEQINGGLPWGKSYIIDQNGIVQASSFGYDPFKTIETINNLLQNSTEIKDLKYADGNKFSLTNYPNPFNTSTKIEFNLSENSKVSLKILDVLGHPIDKLLDEYLNIGQHSYSWNATTYENGVYFCQLEINGKIYTNKMLLKK